MTTNLEIQLPEILLVVGNDGSGNHFSVKREGSGNNIYFFDHEWGEINPKETQSLKLYIKTWTEVKTDKKS